MSKGKKLYINPKSVCCLEVLSRQELSMACLQQSMLKAVVSSILGPKLNAHAPAPEA